MGRYFNQIVTDKTNILSKFSENLFNKYLPTLDNSGTSFEKYVLEVNDKAIEIGLDVDELEIDGELYGFENQEEYTKSEKSLHITYQWDSYRDEPNYIIFNHKWK